MISAFGIDHGQISKAEVPQGAFKAISRMSASEKKALRSSLERRQFHRLFNRHNYKPLPERGVKPTGGQYGGYGRPKY